MFEFGRGSAARSVRVRGGDSRVIPSSDLLSRRVRSVTLDGRAGEGKQSGRVERVSGVGLRLTRGRMGWVRRIVVEAVFLQQRTAGPGIPGRRVFANGRGPGQLVRSVVAVSGAEKGR